MEFFEELGKTISDKGKEVAKRAKDLTESLQLKSQVSAEKAKIQEAYALIGKAYYEDHKDSEDDKYKELFSGIQGSFFKIATLEEEICQLDGNRVCAECGTKVAREDAFCKRCGAPMPSAKDECGTMPDEAEDCEKEDSDCSDDCSFSEEKETEVVEIVEVAETLDQKDSLCEVKTEDDISEEIQP